MSLREELEREIRYELSGNEAVERAYRTGEQRLKPDELVDLVTRWCGALQAAILRLADELDRRP